MVKSSKPSKKALSKAGHDLSDPKSTKAEKTKAAKKLREAQC